VPTENGRAGSEHRQENNPNVQGCIELGGFHAVTIFWQRMKSTRSGAWTVVGRIPWRGLAIGHDLMGW